MKTRTAKLYNWALQKANSSKAPFWIGLLFFLEIALFIPLDAVLMFFCLQDRKKTLSYVAIATLASVLSGLIGYLLGHFLWDLIGSFVVPNLISTASFDRFTSHLQVYESWAIFFGSLLPFPLKVLSFTAGVFQLGLIPFLIYLFLARLLRFSLIGAAMIVWGEKLKNFVDRHFHRLFLLVGAKMAAAFLFFWILAR